MAKADTFSESFDSLVGGVMDPAIWRRNVNNTPAPAAIVNGQLRLGGDLHADNEWYATETTYDFRSTSVACRIACDAELSAGNSAQPHFGIQEGYDYAVAGVNGLRFRLTISGASLLLVYDRFANGAPTQLGNFSLDFSKRWVWVGFDTDGTDNVQSWYSQAESGGLPVGKTNASTAQSTSDTVFDRTAARYFVCGRRIGSVGGNLYGYLDGLNMTATPPSTGTIALLRRRRLLNG